MTNPDPIEVFTRKLGQYSPRPTEDSNSATYVSNLVAGLAASGYSFGVNAGPNATTWIDADNTTPYVALAASGAKGDFTPNTGTTIPFPTGTTINPGTTDYPCRVYRTDTDELWELWNTVVQPNGSLVADWGGYINHASTSSGQFAYPYGCSASGLTMSGLYVTQADLAAGAIEHTIGFCAEALSADNVSPANRWDFGSGSSNIHEGSWLTWQSGYEMPTGMCLLAEAVWQAIKHYGMICMDFGNAYMLNTGAAEPGGTDYVTEAMQGVAEWDVFEYFDWSKLLVLAPPSNWPTGFS